MTAKFEIEHPSDLAHFRLSHWVEARLHQLLERQDGGAQLSEDERLEAEGLVNLAETLCVIKLRSERLAQEAATVPAHLARAVRKRARNRGEYCGLSQVGQEATFHVAHIIPYVLQIEPQVQPCRFVHLVD